MFPTQEHITAAQDAADDERAKSGVYVFPSVALVQAAIESAGWTKLSGTNNGFGIKATQAQRDAGEATLVWTREVVGGQSVKVQQWFANYASLREAYAAHAHLLATSRYYEKARRDTNAEQFLIDIAHSYATDPSYAQVCLSVMRRGDYARYDILSPKAPAPLRPPIAATQKANAPAASAVVVAGATVAAASGGHLSTLAISLGVLFAGICAVIAISKIQDAHEWLALAVTPPAPAKVAPVATIAAKV